MILAWIMDSIIDIKPITNDDIIAYYGKPLKITVRGWAVFHDGELIGLVGISFATGNLLAFSDFKHYNYPKKMRWRVAKILLNMIVGLGYSKFYAVADPKLPNSVEFLKRLGFNHIDSSLKGEVFIWVCQ